MGRIAISEPHEDVRALYRHVIERLGHQPVCTVQDGDAPVDALVVEPASAHGLSLARKLRSLRPELPIVCVSIYPRGPEVTDLRPLAYLVKPFALGELERVLTTALTPLAAAS
jgi:two-component SAPR family response regulator